MVGVEHGPGRDELGATRGRSLLLRMKGSRTRVAGPSMLAMGDMGDSASLSCPTLENTVEGKYSYFEVYVSRAFT